MESNENLILSIFENGVLAPFFVKAVRKIIQENQSLIQNAHDQKQIICDLWNRYYGIDLCLDQQKEFSSIKFKNIKEKTIFLMSYC